MSQNNDILRVLADNPTLMEALEKLLEQEFETPLSDVDGTSDQEIGQRVRARLYGKRAIKSAFIKISKYRTQQEKLRVPNPGR